MCGITGYSGKGDAKVLAAMNDTLRHRGPDDSGVEVLPRAKEGQGTVGLAQRRLAVIDLSPAGHQPLSNETGTVRIAFNGEIYNFKELNAMLKERHSFRGESDTEVIVHLYEELGEGVFEKLQGMFAIALYDTTRNVLFLARDRMGKKPLYWSVQQDTLFFGSELKALMAHPGFTKEIDRAALNKYFLYGYVPTPHTMFKSTYKLEPGTYLAWDGTRVEKTQFWKPTFTPKATSFATSVTDLDAALAKSVEDRLVSDVPLGVLLSGGIDSSTIAHYATRASKEKVKTFAIGFEEASFDEAPFARQVAEHLGTEHHEQILSAHDSLELIPEIGKVLDEPMADSSIVPTYLLSRFAREHVTVALGGDGGDELFAGYDPMLAHKVALLYEYVPKPLRDVWRHLVHLLPTSHRNMSLDFKLKKATADFEGASRYRTQRWMGVTSHDMRGTLFSAEVWEEVGSENEFSDIDRYLKEMDSHDRYDEVLYLFQRMYMMDQVLVKVDRASMAHALEVRAPLLDTRVVDLANHLPSQYKLHGTTRKYILKKLMEDKLPKDIVYRKKKGFGMPIGAWLRGPLAPWMREVLNETDLKTTGLFNVPYVQQLMHEHLEGTRDNRLALWTLLVFMMWWKRWM